MLKLLSELDFRLGNDSWIEDDSHIFGILYYRNIYKCIQFLLAHLSFQAYLDFKPLRLSDTKGRQIHSVMNMRDWWWDTQDQLPAGATTVPVICASNQTHLTNFSGIQHAWPLNLTICNIRNNIRVHLQSTPVSSSAWSHVSQKVPRTWTKHGIAQLEQSCPNSVILTLLAPAWNRIVLMDSSDNVTRGWLPGSEIIRNESWLL